MRTLNVEEIQALNRQLKKVSETKRNGKTPHCYLCS